MFNEEEEAISVIRHFVIEQLENPCYDLFVSNIVDIIKMDIYP